jgi:K+-transporting ATPase KdpF subunit
MKSEFANIYLLSAVLPAHTDATASNSPVSYLIGGIIALLIMGYLIYSLMRPDKF